MKKFFYAFAVMTALCMTSCNGQCEAEKNVSDSTATVDSTMVDSTVVVDSVAVDSIKPENK